MPASASYPPKKFNSPSRVGEGLLQAGANAIESCSNKHGEAAGVQCLRGGEGLTFISARCQKLCAGILKMRGSLQVPLFLVFVQRGSVTSRFIKTSILIYGPNGALAHNNRHCIIEATELL